MKEYGVHHRLSSVAFARSNGRAEVAVKTVKRMMIENTSPNGDLNNDAFQRAMLQYRNTPDRDTRLSPAMCIYGRHIRDFIPILPQKYRPNNIWTDTLTAREEALRNRHMRTQEKLSEHTRRLPPLKVGDHVRIQNQTGPYPLKWDKTGIVIEVRQYDQYMVKIDGSNRTTLRNRRFLRHFIPIRPDPQPRSILEDLKHQQVGQNSPTIVPLEKVITEENPEIDITERTSAAEPHQNQEFPIDPSGSTPTETAQAPVHNRLHGSPLRRSGRSSNPPARLTYHELGNPENE